MNLAQADVLHIYSNLFIVVVVDLCSSLLQIFSCLCPGVVFTRGVSQQDWSLKTIVLGARRHLDSWTENLRIWEPRDSKLEIFKKFGQWAKKTQGHLDGHVSTAAAAAAATGGGGGWDVQQESEWLSAGAKICRFYKQCKKRYSFIQKRRYNLTIWNKIESRINSAAVTYLISRVPKRKHIDFICDFSSYGHRRFTAASCGQFLSLNKEF